jgi:glutamate racemase
MPVSANSCLGIVEWGIGGVGLVRALTNRRPAALLYWRIPGSPYSRMGTEG